MKRREEGFLSERILPSVLVDRVQHAAPARAGRKMQQRVKNTSQALPKSPRVVVRAAGFDRPVNQKGAAHDRFAIDKPPVAAVGAMVAVIAHREILAGRHDNFVTLDVLLDLVRPFWN